MAERTTYNADYYTKGILEKDRIILSKAITVIESTRPEDEALADEILDTCLRIKNKSRRVAISGAPGAGKSTFINTFGRLLLDSGQSLAVLAVDPSSSLSKGSILGDKTRMDAIVTEAFIRPTASSNNLGGVARKTRETILLCEAFGFDYIFVETVGIGQSETMVKNMTDVFLLLLLPNAGDELQGIKRGVMEMADIILINKSEKANEPAAKTAAAQVKLALHLFLENEKNWQTPVLNISSVENTGLDKLAEAVDSYFLKMESSGFTEHNRNLQQIHWMNEIAVSSILDILEKNKAVQDFRASLEDKIRKYEMDANRAAKLLVRKMLDER